MTPEHRATLTRLLAALDSGDVTRPAVVVTRDGGPISDALRAVLAVPEAGEGGAWESAEDFARRHAGGGAVTPLRNLYRDMTAERDAQVADRLAAIVDAVEDGDTIGLHDFLRDLRGLPR